MSKGDTPRTRDLHKYEAKKERIFMSTRDLCLRLGWRFGQLGCPPYEMHQQFQDLVYDVSCITDDKAEAAKEIRRELLAMHEKLDEQGAE